MNQELGSPQIRAAYAFLKSAEQNDLQFTLQDLSAASGWSINTTKANASKKLTSCIVREAQGTFRVSDMSAVTLVAFCRLCSQSSARSGDPLRPMLTPTAEGLVVKAREAALAAVQHYNNPSVTFRTGNFVILIVIAFTALFHAVFERDEIDYTARDEHGIPKRTPQGALLWDLSYCVDAYIDKYVSSYDAAFLSAFKKNIEFFIPIRNKIEHRQMPQIDPEVAGHCQSMLFNLEKILKQEFTAYYSLSSTLTLALQFSTERSPQTTTAMRSGHTAEYQWVSKYINEFHNDLPDEIMENPAFALRLWLVPKPAKDARASDMTLEYVKLDASNAEQTADLVKKIVAVNKVDREAADIGRLKAGEVSKQVQEKIGRRFAASTQHVRAYLHHKIRPPNGSSDPAATQKMYCVYNKTFGQYAYTEEWVKLLIREYQDPVKYKQVLESKSSS